MKEETKNARTMINHVNNVGFGLDRTGVVKTSHYTICTNSGITLVALIITIIILIILAGVTLNITLGENGILRKSKEAVNKYQKSAETEASILEQLEKNLKGQDYGTPWTGGIDTNWYNNTDTEFVITTAEELAGFAQLVNRGNTFEGKTVKLGQSIDLGATWSEEENLISGTEWTPIAQTSINAFKGIFDGQNYSVKNMYINKTNSCQGFFGYNQGKIMNVGIEAGYIKGDSYTAGIVGENSAIIQNCYNKAKVVGVDGANDIAGIAGGNFDGGQIIRCYNMGEITGGDEIGGIVGDHSEGTIMYCYNSGKLQGDGSYSGFSIAGISGYVNKGSIQYCYNKGEITGGTVSGIAPSDAELIQCFYWEEIAEQGSSEVNDEEGKVESTSENLNSFEEFLVWIQNK